MTISTRTPEGDPHRCAICGELAYTVELVMELEEEFDINIPDEEAEKIQTVADAIRAILRRRNQFPGEWKSDE